MIEKAGEKAFRQREVRFRFRSEIQTETPENRWFKTASYIGHGPGDIILDKIQQQK